MRITNSYYLIVDVEATCSNDGEVPRDEMEIIEIGAVMQNAKSFEIASEFQCLVRPICHPTLTLFCSELTGITQSDVEKGRSFPEAIKAMTAWMRPFADALFCSWGNYDRKQFMQDCGRHHVNYPFGSEHLNLKSAFADCFGLRKEIGVAQAVQRVGLTFEGNHHRGLDDARNMARVVRRVCVGM